MTVKVEGPVLESEPIVINEQLTRQCAEVMIWLSRPYISRMYVHKLGVMLDVCDW